MLWTLKGLCLLLALGLLGGAGLAVPLARVIRKKSKWWLVVLFYGGMIALVGAVYLIAQWVGPAGGGG